MERMTNHENKRGVLLVGAFNNLNIYWFDMETMVWSKLTDTQPNSVLSKNMFGIGRGTLTFNTKSSYNTCNANSKIS